MRGQARSAAPSRGSSADADEVAALRAQLQDMETRLRDADGQLRQLRADRADREAAAAVAQLREAPSPPAPASLPPEDATPAAYLDLTRATPPFEVAHVQSARTKAAFAAWANPAALRCWIMVGECPAVTTFTQADLQSVLRDSVHVTPEVHAQLTSMSGFRLRAFVARGDDSRHHQYHLIEHLDTLVEAVLTVLGLGITAEASLDRLHTLREGLAAGADRLRLHCRQHRSRLSDRAPIDPIAYLID